MFEVWGYITLGLLWLVIATVLGIAIGRSMKLQSKLPLAKFPVLFQWRLNPSHDLKEVVICCDIKILWRGPGAKATVHLPLGYSEVLFYYIDKDNTVTKETVDVSLDSDGILQSHSREIEIYPMTAEA